MPDNDFWTDSITYTPADHFSMDCEILASLFKKLEKTKTKVEANEMIKAIKPYLKEIECLLKREEMFT